MMLIVPRRSDTQWSGAEHWTGSGLDILAKSRLHLGTGAGPDITKGVEANPMEALGA